MYIILSFPTKKQNKTEMILKFWTDRYLKKKTSKYCIKCTQICVGVTYNSYTYLKGERLILIDFET